MLKKHYIPVGTISQEIEKMSKFNDNKKSGFGHTLLVLSTGKKFRLIKNFIRYESDTLKEMQNEFEGYFLKSETSFKFFKNK